MLAVTAKVGEKIHVELEDSGEILEIFIKDRGYNKVLLIFGNPKYKVHRKTKDSTKKIISEFIKYEKGRHNK